METIIKGKSNRGKKLSQNNSDSDDATVFKNIKRTSPVNNSENRSRSTEEKTVVKSQNRASSFSNVNHSPRADIKSSQPVRGGSKTNKTPRILQKRFKLEKVLGIGGMGVVYKAIDLRKVEAKDRNPYVAIKVLNEEFKKHPDSLIALQREARKSQSIAHPNIVNVHDFDRDGDIVFMTMEFLDGLPLDKVIKQYQYIGLPMNQAWGVLKGICEALIYAHHENIIHSDFKPGNIYLTSKGVAKVFDFGISRAVSVSDLKSDSGEKTIFDAGSLGALTPAYASLEMLNGSAPDERDDVYALACVAYEIFSGEHPFGKLSAEKAMSKKLKPKKIQELSSTQWNTLKKALSFKRKDRIASVEDFYNLMFSEQSSGKKIAAMIAVLVTITLSSVLYYDFNKDSNVIVQQGISQEDIDLYKEDIENLLQSPKFSSIQWHDDVWVAFKMLWKVIPESDSWAYSAESKVIKIYTNEINSLIRNNKVDEADILLSEAVKYSDNKGLLQGVKRSIQELRSKIGSDEIAKLKQQQYEQQRRFDIQKANLRKNILNEQKFNSAEIQRKYNLALNDVSKHLLCREGINVRRFGKSLKILSLIDEKRYKKQKSGLIDSTISCINKISIDSQSKAKKLKSYAVQYFPASNKLKQLEIGYIDLCKPAFAGKAAKNSRSICQDPLASGVIGPKMVVVNPNRDKVFYAISKYEISNRDFNNYCEATDKCRPKVQNLDYPVNNISITQANSYIKWLSLSSHQKYSLPSYYQWIQAAKASRSVLDPNRNCSMNSRGIIKGVSLTAVTSGKQNDWGLVNAVGNVEEWVLKGRGRELYAAGGSRIDEFSNCNIRSLKKHSGKANELTGFRVVREII